MLKLPFTLMLLGTLTATLFTPPVRAQSAPAIAINTTAARTSLETALTKYESGDIQAAIKELDRAIAIDNKYIDAYLYRGVLVTLGQVDLSSGDANLLRGKNSIPKAGIADFDRILAIQPNHVRALAYRGHAKIINGDLTGMKDIDRAIAIAPDNLAPYLIKSFVSLGKISRTETKKIVDLSRGSDNLLISLFMPIAIYDSNKSEINRGGDTSKLTTAKAYLDRAIDKISLLDFKGANVDLTQAIELDPKSTQAYFYRGLIGTSNERERSQIDADFKRAKALDPLDPKLSIFSQLFTGGLEAKTGETMDLVNAELDKAIAATPKSADLYPIRSLFQRMVLLDRDNAMKDIIQAGKIYRERDNLEMYFFTHAYLSDTIKKPISATEYITVADLYIKADRLQLAMANIDKAIAIEPQSTYPYTARADLKFIQKDYRGALTDIDKAIAIQPSMTLYLQRAQLKVEKLNDSQSAIGDYDKAIAIDPKSTYTYLRRAEFRAEKLKDLKGAASDYNRTIAIQPKAAIGYTSRARFYAYQLQNNRLALADFNRVIRLEPKNPFSYVQRAMFKAKNLKDMKGALADYDRAIATNPNNGFLYINRAGFKYEYLKDTKSALADYNLAIVRDEKDAYVYAERAKFKSTKLKDNNGALADFDRAISIKADEAEFYLHRGDLKASSADKTAAIADYRQAALLFRQGSDRDNLDLVSAKLKALGASVN